VWHSYSLTIRNHLCPLRPILCWLVPVLTYCTPRISSVLRNAVKWAAKNWPTHWSADFLKFSLNWLNLLQLNSVNNSSPLRCTELNWALTTTSELLYSSITRQEVSSGHGLRCKQLRSFQNVRKGWESRYFHRSRGASRTGNATFACDGTNTHMHSGWNPL
jgi:hypothetical protein